jgi:hypothetical protein
MIWIAEGIMSEWAVIPGWETYKVHKNSDRIIVSSVSREVPTLQGHTKKIRAKHLTRNKGGRNYTLRNPKNATQKNFTPEALWSAAWETGEPPLDVVAEGLLANGETLTDRGN